MCQFCQLAATSTQQTVFLRINHLQHINHGGFMSVNIILFPYFPTKIYQNAVVFDN